MVKKEQKSVTDFIVPLYINGLQGRMLRSPAPDGKTREILFVYGHHSSLERWWGLIQDLNQYGAVTMPDLPGFGGMDSFYKIGRQPTIDDFADYLATFIKLRYKRKRLTIVGLSFGFVVVTRMLQRYPDIAKKVDLLVSVVGFAHKGDFTFTRPRYLFYHSTAVLLSHQIPAKVFRTFFLNRVALNLAYAKMHNAKGKFEKMTKSQQKATMRFEVYLWHSNDLRTQAATLREFLQLNNCNQHVDLTLWHVSVKNDRYFDNHIVEQHMRIIFSNFHEVKAKTETHAPSVIADMEIAAKIIPLKIRQLLSENP